ncbi:MAG: hypothetical protein U0269_13135 [Polyangiales bacterium]
MATSKRAAGTKKSSAKRKATPNASRAKKPATAAPKTLCAVTLAAAGARFFAPARPRLAVAREAIASITDPAEAWEALAARSVIPLSWLAHPTRQIVADGVKCPRCRDPFIGHSKRCPVASTPATVRAAVALAADPDAVEAVEALALEAFARMRPTAEKPRRIVWRVVGSDAPTVLYTKRPGAHLAPSIHKELLVAGDALAKATGLVTQWGRPADIRTMNYGANTDQQLARRGYASNHFALAMAFRTDALHQWAWDAHARKRALPNPFTPLCEAWMLGYAIDGVDEDALVLIALDPEATRDELTAAPKRQ